MAQREGQGRESSGPVREQLNDAEGQRAGRRHVAHGVAMAERGRDAASMARMKLGPTTFNAW